MNKTAKIDYQNQTIEQWIESIESAVKQELVKASVKDGSHDFEHLNRVSSLARSFARAENGSELVAFAAGMLHDIVNLPKNDPDSKNSSFYASERSKIMLSELNFPKELVPNVCHAVHAHSFSAKIEPETVEARCVQDADRMEALGAFGLMRVFYCAGMFGSKIIDESDPAGENRELNDKKFALDHFVIKLLTLHGTMKTKAGSLKAQSLSTFLEEYRHGLISDQIKGELSSGRFKIANVYYDAGQKKLPLFCNEDPFAEKGRKLDFQNFALDNLLHEEDLYVKKFLTQLRFELQGSGL